MAPHATAPLEARAASSSSADKPHDDYGPQFNVTIWFLTAVAAIFLCLRLYCKRIRRKKLWWDDYVLIAAFVMLFTQTTLLSVLVHMGFGKHSWDITDWYHWLLVANVTGVCSITAAAWSKTSFAITLLRFSDGWARWLVWFVIVSVNLFLGLSGLFTYVQCWPISQLWDSTVEGTCWPQHVIVYYNSFSSAYSGAMDILLATLPWWIINRRSLSRKERLGVLVAMSMGVFAGITSIAKTATLWAIKDPDAIHTVSLMILATAESAITIVAASIPVLRALIKTSLRAETDPHFYRYYNSQDTPPSQALSNRELMAPSPAVTKPAKGSSQFSTEVSSPGSSTGGKTWARRDGDSWLSSASGLELAAREEEGMRTLYVP